MKLLILGYLRPRSCAIPAKEVVRLRGFGQNMKERWKKIDGFGGRYEVSDKGVVRGPNGIKKHWINNKGYPTVSLCFQGKSKTLKIHRLVALAFIPNPDPKKFYQVNHKDHDKQNSSIDNLEWGNHSTNLKHDFATGRRSNKGSFGPSYGKKRSQAFKMKDRLKAYNRKARNKNGFVGVHWREKERLWIARGVLEGKPIYLGCFKDKKDAIKARKIFNETMLKPLLRRLRRLLREESEDKKDV